MIIDCHGHYTTTPPAVEQYRNAQKALLEKNTQHQFGKEYLTVSDDEIRDSIRGNQLALQQARGIDLLLSVIPAENILFASEMIGAVRGIDPQSGHHYDDRKRFIDTNTTLTEEQKAQIFAGKSTAS